MPVELYSSSVRVIDATTGMASDGAGARPTFGALALVNDTVLELVRTETHRGLEGRAWVHRAAHNQDYPGGRGRSRACRWPRSKPAV